MVELGLGRKLDAKTFNELATIQFSLREEQQKLVSALEAGKLDPDKYLSYLNGALGRAMDESKKVLGMEQFLAIFGKAGLQPEHIGDLNIFFGEKPWDLMRPR